METLAWSFTLITVALLLDPTFADVLVQPGYNQPSGSSSKSQAMNEEQKNQQMTGQSQSQQNYAGAQQNMLLQLLQHQHMLQQQHLNNIHQYEQKQLVQMQRQQLQHPMVQRQKVASNDQMVGMMPFGLSPLPGIVSGLGDIATGRLFSMGPMGLNSFTLGGLRPPLLMSTQQPQQMSGSTQFQKSSNGVQDQTRTKREVRDAAGESGSKKFRQSKSSRQQPDGVAANSPVKPKSDNNAVTSQQNPSQSPSKSNDDHVVGSSRGMNDDTVGGPLDDLIENLKNSGLVNPLMDLLNGGGMLPQPHLLGSSASGIPQFDEHIVGQSHQQQQQQIDQNPMISSPGHHHNLPSYNSYGHHHPHHLPSQYGIRPTKYYPYKNNMLGSPSPTMMNEGSSMPFQSNQGQGFWTGAPHQIQPGTGSGSSPQVAAPDSVSKSVNPAAKFVKDPVIRYSMSQRTNEDPVIPSSSPGMSKATQPIETSKPAIVSESPVNPIQSQTMMPAKGAVGKSQMMGAQYPFNMVQPNMVQMMAPYNAMMRSISSSPMVGAANPTDQLSGLLYTLADQLSTFGRGGDQFGIKDRYQSYRDANFGLGDFFDRGYGSYPGHGNYGGISGIGYDESPYSTIGGYNPPYQYNQQSYII